MSEPRLKVVHVNLAFERTADLRTLVERYRSLSELCEAQTRTGAMEVHALLRFWRDEDLVRNDVTYHARADAPWRLVPGLFTRCLALWQLARDLQPDVVHFAGLMFPAQLAALRRAVGPSAVIVMQDHHTRPGRRLGQLARRVAFPMADGFIFTTNGLAEPWRQRGILRSGQPVFEISGASTHFQVYADARVRIPDVAGSPNVLWVGRLMTAKDPVTAVEGFVRAAERLPDARLFMIYQRGDLLSDIQRILQRRPGLSERIRLVGEVAYQDLEAWYNAADLFLTTSPSEGGNFALVEALACGLPPVCSDNPTNQFLTDDGAVGALFPTGSVEACAEAILSVAARLETGAPAMRAAARARFDAVASWPVIASRSLAAYRTLLEARR